MKKIGMLTSGGDCQALNAAMRGVVKGICNKRKDVEIYGFKDGYKGLIYSDFNMLTSKDFSGILTQGGTILGTSRQPFKLMRVPDKDGIDKVEAMKHTYHKLHLDCLVILGGNGTHKTANLLREEGLNVVTLPKTIDNDLWGTDMTFGFQSAVDIATDTIDRIHTTATSHSRVFIIEVMGHKVGHVTLHAGIAGGADIILLPEIPYDIKAIKNVIDKRTQAGKRFTILAVAEGAISKEDAKLKKKEYKEKLANRKYPSIAYELAEQIEKEFAKTDEIANVLIEVNMAQEESKFGITSQETEELIREIAKLPHVRIQGLMTIAPFTDNPETNRVYFKNMKKLSVDINNKNIDNVSMNVLSMGMTGDYQVAVEEGATMVRVGTGIFGERNYNI